MILMRVSLAFMLRPSLVQLLSPSAEMSLASASRRSIIREKKKLAVLPMPLAVSSTSFSIARIFTVDSMSITSCPPSDTSPDTSFEQQVHLAGRRQREIPRKLLSMRSHHRLHGRFEHIRMFNRWQVLFRHRRLKVWRVIVGEHGSVCAPSCNSPMRPPDIPVSEHVTSGIPIGTANGIASLIHSHRYTKTSYSSVTVPTGGNCRCSHRKIHFR